MAEVVKIPPAKSISDLLKQNFKTFDFQGDFKDSFGKPERNGAWLVWGGSGDGKTDFSLQMAKYLSNFGKVYYNTLEERGRESFRIACIRNNIESCGSKFQYESEKYEQMMLRLTKKRAPKIVIIDSLQYLRITAKQYDEMRKLLPNTLFIFISHAKGALPKGALADEIRYDADVKIYIKDFVAKIQSRFGGNKPFVIWEAGMREAELKLT